MKSVRGHLRTRFNAPKVNCERGMRERSLQQLEGHLASFSLETAAGRVCGGSIDSIIGINQAAVDLLVVGKTMREKPVIP